MHERSTSTRLTVGTDGSPVVIKVGDAARLRREAERLEQVAGPGVVELVALDAAADGTAVLRTAYAGRHTVADLAPMPPAEAATIAQVVATTLAAAHERGVVHGRIAPDHVIVGADGTPRLCGWSGDEDASRSDDVAGVGRVLEAALGGATGTAADVLRGVAALAQAPDPLVRPSMHGLATAIDRAAPGSAASAPRASAGVIGPRGRARARGPVDGGSRRSRRPPWRLTLESLPLRHFRPPAPDGRLPIANGRVAAGLAAGAALLGAGLLVGLTPIGGGTSPPTDDTAARAAHPTHPTHPSVPAAPAGPSTTASSPAGAAAGEAAPVLEVAGGRWQVGAPGDVAVVGDWDCDGTATPAVVRPSSGAVFAFPAWADGDVAPFTTVDGAVTARAIAVARGGACAAVEIVRADGARVVVTPPR